jgi:hypothetical protein
MRRRGHLFLLCLALAQAAAVHNNDEPRECTLDSLPSPKRSAKGREAFEGIKERHASDLSAGVLSFIMMTSINPPTRQVQTLCKLQGWNKVVAGDTASPKGWKEPGCVFLDIDDQHALKYEVTSHIPTKRYERKIIGYLFAIEAGATIVLDTDDDNVQLGDAPLVLDSQICATTLSASRLAWNAYGHFGKPGLWNRGLPLDQVQTGKLLEYAPGPRLTRPLIQQGLADIDPDLDALTRLLKSSEETRNVRFAADSTVLAFEPASYQPMNSQNTIFLRDALWALILPVTTLWREDDIYRGYWAQRLLWEIGGTFAYVGATAMQLRNPHDYLKDLAQEINMYRDTAAMLRFMNEWRCADGIPLDECMVQLQLALHERKFIGCKDVHLVRAFVRDMNTIGYSMPTRRPWNASIALGPMCETPAKMPDAYLEASKERRSMTRLQIEATFDKVECGQGATRGCEQTVFLGEQQQRATAPTDTSTGTGPRQAATTITSPERHVKRRPLNAVALDNFRGPARTGRTAVCMNGMPRSFDLDLTNRANMEHATLGATATYRYQGRLLVNNRSFVGNWAGPTGNVHPEWLVAHSIRNNVLNTLAKTGYDLFIIEPGVNNDFSKWDILKDTVNAVSADGTPNRMFVMDGGPEPDLYYNKSDPRWQVFFYSKRLGFKHAHSNIESELYQLRHLKMCNDAVRKHAESSGKQYTFKMRLRPDFAWVKPFPSLEEISTVLTPKRVLVSSPLFYNGGNNDTFMFGLAEPMDKLFDKEEHIHDFDFRSGWANEEFTMSYLLSVGIVMRFHEGILTKCVRRLDFPGRGTRVKSNSDSAE